MRLRAYIENINDYKMQKYIYKKQLSAYRCIISVTDKEVEEFARISKHYSIQKYVYDKQISAKQYMEALMLK